MARTNHTRFVILGFLTHGPRSGYDIRKAIGASLGNFWNESFGQIYPALKAMEAEGLVRRAPAEGRSDRQAYVITERGRKALEGWVKEPAAPHVYRVETLVKLFFAPTVGPEEALKHVARFQAEHEALLAHYRAIQEHLDRSFAEDPDQPYWKLTVACGLKVSQAYAAWCQEARTVLAGLAQGGKHA